MAVNNLDGAVFATLFWKKPKTFAGSQTPCWRLNLFCSVIRQKATPLGGRLLGQVIVPDEPDFIALPTYLEPTKSPQGPLWNELGKTYPLILSTGTMRE